MGCRIGNIRAMLRRGKQQIKKTNDMNQLNLQSLIK